MTATWVSMGRFDPEFVPLAAGCPPSWLQAEAKTRATRMNIVRNFFPDIETPFFGISMDNFIIIPEFPVKIKSPSFSPKAAEDFERW
jgi:hypothetical protein